jgi:hypothetical protein
MSLAKKMLKSTVIATALGLYAMSAQAGWTFTADTTDPFTNPENGLAQGTGNPPTDIQVWLKGLYNLSDYPTFTEGANVNASIGTITGLDAIIGSILTLHYGNTPDTAYPGNNLTFAYQCVGDAASCGSFVLSALPPNPDNGLSNYRLWNGDPGNKTPEPGTALLLGLGLFGIAAMRRRKQHQ